MRRVWLGIGILVFLFTIGIAADIILDHICQPISENLTKASNLAENGQFEQAFSMAMDAKKSWEHAWHGVGFLSDHSPMDEIDGLFSQAQAYAQMGAYDDFSASCARISNLITAVAEAHSLSWWNLF